MKKWTVMLIPHDRGNTRNLEVAAYHLGLVVALLVALSFSTAFLLKRHQGVSSELERLRHRTQALERVQANEANVREGSLSETERAEIEREIRDEYEANMATITAALTDLYKNEADARQLVGLPPRTPANTDALTAMGSGKGGAPGGLDEVPYADRAVLNRPPHIIYGLSRPSADLILQEINLRTASLQELVADISAERNRMERLPSIWPTESATRRISSHFGYRKDPFTRRVRHHDGTDIVAPYGSPVRATGKGVVTFAGTERYLGKIVKIDHGNGLETWYAHLRSLSVNKGDDVERFEIIGTLGNTGRSTGAHLHYEIHEGGRAVDARKTLRD